MGISTIDAGMVKNADMDSFPGGCLIHCHRYIYSFPFAQAQTAVEILPGRIICYRLVQRIIDSRPARRQLIQDTVH